MLQNKFENQNHLTCTDFQQREFFQAAVERNKMLSTMIFDTESRICFVNSVLKQWYGREKTKLQHLVPNNLSFTFLLPLQKMSLLTRLQNILEWQVPSMPLPTRQQTIFAVWLTFRCFFDSKSTRFSRPKHCYCQQVDKAFRCIGLVTVLPSGTLFVGKRFFLTDLCKPCWLKTENVHERKFFF